MSATSANPNLLSRSAICVFFMVCTINTVGHRRRALGLTHLLSTKESGGGGSMARLFRLMWKHYNMPARLSSDPSWAPYDLTGEDLAVCCKILGLSCGKCHRLGHQSKTCPSCKVTEAKGNLMYPHAIAAAAGKKNLSPKDYAATEDGAKALKAAGGTTTTVPEEEDESAFFTRYLRRQQDLGPWPSRS